MQIDLKTLDPWSEFHSIISNASSMSITANGKKFSGKAMLDIDDENHVSIVVGKANGKDRKGKK